MAFLTNEFADYWSGPVAADFVGQSFVVIYGLAIVQLYIQSLIVIYRTLKYHISLLMSWRYIFTLRIKQITIMTNLFASCRSQNILVKVYSLKKHTHTKKTHTHTTKETQIFSQEIVVSEKLPKENLFLSS